MKWKNDGCEWKSFQFQWLFCGRNRGATSNMHKLMRWKHSFLCTAFEPTALHFDQFMNFCGKRFHEWNNIFFHFSWASGGRGTAADSKNIFFHCIHITHHTHTTQTQKHLCIRPSPALSPSCIWCSPSPLRGESFGKPKIYFIVIPWFSLKYFVVLRILDPGLATDSSYQLHTDSSTSLILVRMELETNSPTLFLCGIKSETCIVAIGGYFTGLIQISGWIVRTDVVYVWIVWVRRQMVSPRWNIFRTRIQRLPQAMSKEYAKNVIYLSALPQGAHPPQTN